jgi:hypothetical protein
MAGEPPPLDLRPAVTPIPREQAVEQLAAAIADRRDYLIPAPSLNRAVGYALHLVGLPATWYLDSGQALVMRISGRAGDDTLAGLTAIGLVVNRDAVTGVGVIPKSPRARARFERVIGRPIGPGEDLIIAVEPDPAGEPRIAWPTLAVDAIDRLDPVAAARIRAGHLPDR